MRRGLGTSRTSLNIPTSESGVPEGEEEQQEIVILYEQIMENFPSLVKEIRLPGSPGNSENPK